MKELEKITGKLLGDGNITIEKNKRGRFRFSHTTKDKDWCFHCYDELKDYLPLNEPKERTLKDPRTKKGYTSQFYVQSRTHPTIDHLKKIWYPNGIKVLPIDFIEMHLSETALAWWYYDDGSLKLDQYRKPSKIILSTDSFSPQKNTHLAKLLFQKFHLDFKLDGQNRLILYDRPSIYYFLRVVNTNSPFIIQRKHYQPSNTQYFYKPHRTTIYLPNNIQLSKPTSQINNALKLNLHNIIEQVEGNTGLLNYIQEFILYNKVHSNKHNSYQIRVENENLNLLTYLKNITGMNYSFIAYKCFSN